MNYSRWRIATTKAILAGLLKDNPKIMDEDEKEWEANYRTSGKEIVLVEKIKTKPTSFWKIVWLYFSAIIVDKFSKGRTT